MEIVKSLEETELLMKGISKTIKSKTTKKWISSNVIRNISC